MTALAHSGGPKMPGRRRLNMWRQRLPSARPVAQPGQSLTEFALVVPLILSLVYAIVAFGILFEDKIALNNAARDGARWATQNPDAWDNSSTASSTSIQGQIQGEGGTVNIPNDDTHINISYYTVTYDSTTGSPSSPTFCGSYSVSTNTAAMGCLAPGNLIQVTVTQTFAIPVPLISRLFTGGVTLVASATMTEEDNP